MLLDYFHFAPFLITSTKLYLGTGAFWFNVGSNMRYDTRIFHLGCPVMVGNKWIVNQWIKILGQFKHYPCNDNKEHYNIFSNK